LKKVLITGITGFVGNHLKTFLEKKGYTVFGIASTIHQREENVFHVDLTDYPALKKVLQKVQPDVLYHLAALSSPKESFNAPLTFHAVNYTGTLHLYEAMRETGVICPVLFVSSSEVHGKPSQEKLPVTENTPVSPESPYAASKAAGEIVSRQYINANNFDIRIVRPFNHYGTGQNEQFVLANFAQQIAEIVKKKKEPVLMTGNLALHRDFTHIYDVVRAYFLIAEKGKPGEIYTLCSGSKASLQEYVNILLSFAEIPIKVQTEQKRLRKNEVTYYYGSFEKLFNEVGWKPEISMEEGLKELFNYYCNR